MTKWLVSILTLFIGQIVFSPLLSAQSEDDKVIITNQDAKYTFVVKNKKLEIKEILFIEYECIQPGAITPIIKMYDSESTIDKVTIKGQKGVKPEYEMYSDENIFYSDAKLCRFNLSFLKKGEKAQVIFETTYHDPRYFPSIYLSDVLFVKKKTVSISVPLNISIQLKEFNLGENVRKQQQSHQQNKEFFYEISNVQAMKWEPNMQGKGFIYPHLLLIVNNVIVEGERINYFENLDSMYKWHYSLFQKIENNQSIIKDKAQEITKDCKTEQEKINKLFAWVQNNIRYVAFEDGISAFKPDDAHEVLRKKYGDCKGMANLLKSLLIAEGFDARLSFLGTNHLPYDLSIASLGVSNHMICTLYYNGETYYLDPTVQFLGVGEYSQHIQGKQIIIEDGENYQVETIPILPPNTNTDSLYCEFTIEDGILQGKATNSFTGEGKQVLFTLIDHIPKSKQNNVIGIFLQRGNSEDLIKDIEISNGERNLPLKVNYSIDCKSGIQVLENEYYINLNLDKYLPNSIIDTAKRINDVLLPFKTKFVRNIEIRIPTGYKPDHIPSNFEIHRDLYGITIQYEQYSDKLTYFLEISVKELLLQKKYFEEFNNDMRALLKAYSESLTFVKQEDQ